MVIYMKQALLKNCTAFFNLIITIHVTIYRQKKTCAIRIVVVEVSDLKMLKLVSLLDEHRPTQRYSSSTFLPAWQDSINLVANVSFQIFNSARFVFKHRTLQQTPKEEVRRGHVWEPGDAITLTPRLPFLLKTNVCQLPINRLIHIFLENVELAIGVNSCVEVKGPIMQVRE
jgi:hypothetical protein